MISKIEKIPRSRALKRLVLIAAVLNVLAAVLFLIPFRSTYPEMDLIPTAGFIAFVLLVVNLVIYLEYRASEKDLLDSLNFFVELKGGTFETKTARYDAILKQVEEYLARNRISSAPRPEGFRFGGFRLPHAKVYALDSYGLTLKVKREKLGRFASVARIILGPVTGGEQQVPRRMLAELRSELERTLGEK